MQPEFKYIYQLYLDGSFSKAAQHLYISQPALSIALQKMEASIGMPLFDRSRRPLRLTPAGQAYIQTIERIQGLEYDLEKQIYDFQNLNSGSLRLGGSHYLNAYILPKLLTGFSRMYPGIELEIMEESSDVLTEMLRNRNIDLTFSCDSDLMKEFERYSCFQDHILLAVPYGCPLNAAVRDKALTARDIMEEKHLSSSCPLAPFQSFCDLEYILLTPGNNLYDRAVQIFKEAGVEPKVKLHLSQLATAYHLAAEDFGCTFVSDRLIRTAEVPLLFYKLESPLATRTFYAILPDRNYTSFAVKSFIQYLLVN
ncbi:MAG: LysR family transcriptional regulator [Hungatella sp.]|nr:LysR family transcriptional regulator [Hungatella sp.]